MKGGIKFIINNNNNKLYAYNLDIKDLKELLNLNNEKLNYLI